jgi:branched-chain amino acid transport system permease protein
MRYFIQNVIDVISLGCLYSLIALGLALVFGIMRFINFAHGELIMLTGYALYVIGGDRSFLLMILGGYLAVVLIALLMERVAFRPIRGASVSTQLVTSFAVAFLIENIVTVIFGARAKSVAMPRLMSNQTTLAGFRINNLDLITAAVAVALFVGLTLFLRRTSLGTQMRAAAEDFEMARTMGVRANTIIASAFAISGLLAGTAGIILVARSGTLVPTMGLRPIVIGFVAIIVGGLGSLVGAAVGSFVLSFLTVSLQAVLPYGLRQFRDAFVFAAVVAIFFVRPSGIIVDRRLRARV